MALVNFVQVIDLNQISSSHRDFNTIDVENKRDCSFRKERWAIWSFTDQRQENFISFMKLAKKNGFEIRYSRFKVELRSPENDDTFWLQQLALNRRLYCYGAANVVVSSCIWSCIQDMVFQVWVRGRWESRPVKKGSEVPPVLSIPPCSVGDCLLCVFVVCLCVRSVLCITILYIANWN